MQPVTIFGGTGFLGAAIARRLIAAGRPVRIACRHPAALEPGQTSSPVEHVPADIRDETTVTEALEGAGAVVNAVGLYVDRTGSEFESVHVRGAARLARLARKADVRSLVHISGIGVDKRSPSRYVRARGRGESAVRDAFPEAAILRPSVLFGAGDSFLSTLDALTALPAIPLFGNGGTRLQPVHVDDVAEAVARVIDADPPLSGVFELGGKEVLTYRETLEAVLQHRGRWRPLLPVPFALWHLLAILGRVLPNPPLTRDQIVLMQADNIVAKDVAGFTELGITPRGLRASLADCLA